MKRFLALLAIFAFLLSSCATDTVLDPEESPLSAPEKPDNSAFGVAFTESDGCDPYKTPSKLNAELMGLICEGLFYVDTSFSPVPCLCESFTNNGSSYTFNIKQGVTFSDGSELTASDVEYSLRAALEQGSSYATRLSDITSVKASSKYTVTVYLRRENGHLPALLDIPIIKKGTRDDTIPLGTGMFYPSEDRTRLIAKRDHHSGKAPLYSTITLSDVSSTDELIFEFESGVVSIITGDPAGTAPLALRGQNQLYNVPTLRMQYIGFNMSNPILSDASMRRAISRAIDRESAAEKDFALMARPSELPIHPSADGSDVAAAALAFSPEEKITPPEGAELSILVNSETAGKISVCERIAAELTKRGIPTEVRALPFNEYAKALQSGDFSLYLGEVYLSCDFDLSRIIKTGGALNYGRFANADLDSLMSDYLASDEGKAPFLSKFSELVPIAPVLFRDSAMYSSPGFFESTLATSQNIYTAFNDWRLG